MDEPEVGTPCLHSSVSNYIFALSIPGDIRLACFNLKNHKPRQFIDFNKENLECSPAGKCQCIWHSSSRMQYLDYQGKCYAEHGAICKLEAEERNTDYDQSDGHESQRYLLWRHRSSKGTPVEITIFQILRQKIRMLKCPG
ncbi:unnamed protein product [Allacma fusca]|uniref:Uncharacterized protein n=1 Tax=Allacma fusca TaxID=39272 RepID=A0A8J2LAY1_9HEXA|nr:unnamed protein product [Allacma fusca]